MTKMQYSNLLKGFIQELDDCYVLMKKKQKDNNKSEPVGIGFV